MPSATQRALPEVNPHSRREEVAKKTFNPRLGILGGISVLGTSGIVVPMSEDALIASIHAEMRLRKENGGDYLLITPGKLWSRFCEQLPGCGCGKFLSSAAIMWEKHWIMQ